MSPKSKKIEKSDNQSEKSSASALVKKTNGSEKKSGVALGLTTAAVVTAAAGAYLLYSKNGREYQKKIQTWIQAAKGEVLEKIKKMKHLDQEQYLAMVEKAIHRYRALRNIDPKEIETLVQDLKSHWSTIRKQFETPK